MPGEIESLWDQIETNNKKLEKLKKNSSLDGGNLW